METWLWGSVAVFCAALVQGCAGFGFALVCVPCLMLLLPHTTAVPVHFMLAMLSTTIVAIEARRHIRAGILLPLTIGGIAGLPIGLKVLTSLDGPVFKTMAGAFIMLFAVVLLSGWSYPVKNQRVGLVPVGLASGMLGGSISIAGPPAVMFLTNQGVPKEIFRANLVTFFFIINCWGLALFTHKGFMTTEVLGYAGLMAPTLALGSFLGVKASRTVPERHFRKLTMVIVFVMGAVLTWKSVRAI